METRRVAIACQGGGIHGAFTCGVLDALLQAKEDEATSKANSDARRSFEIVGLSGTSAGALNAFSVWYGLMAKGDRTGSIGEARRVLKQLWDTFQVQKLGEYGMNWFGQQIYKLAEMGLMLKQPYPAQSHELLMASLKQWSGIEEMIAPHADLGEIRPEFYDFMALLETCAPEFGELDLARIAEQKTGPRLLLGAVEIISGAFTAFDSWFQPAMEARYERRGPISREAVAASGTLPDLRPAQRIPGMFADDQREGRYWDGVFSQNPPVRQFLADSERNRKPQEIWVIRINPQRRSEAPRTLGMIEDRRNELSGNLSLNQELYFIEKINQWLARLAPIARTDPEHPAVRLFDGYQPVTVYTITMDRSKAELGVASKFDRQPEFVQELREHGALRARQFLPLWLAESPRLIAWPQGDALDD
ncbi:MAG: patatin-like phospholipase family protein [Candidatus Accumulibacter sp.]|uniref:patatin-like phospholipase family protein n=1 Tax=Accumulibacter sp. TaxID=2053492 RepID=UPI00287903EB|nr:patatin-like phospholipase family protein [Accumulibacter sp.]MDS4014036.1 patatin-like phospholipase family protein [Accumulibacter sp.]